MHPALKIMSLRMTGDAEPAQVPHAGHQRCHASPVVSREIDLSVDDCIIGCYSNTPIVGMI